MLPDRSPSSRSAISGRLRPAGFAFLVLAAVAAARVGAAGPLPVTVEVAVPATLLRSGPGDDFYPTERLSRSTRVEVWAVDGSGFCAVRPVEDSFSWVRAADVAAERPGDPLDRGDVGVVVTDGAVARVGSQLNDLRHVSQVALEAGERVRVIERLRISTGRHAGEWLRIDPPAGEFRWAWAGDLDLPAEVAPYVEPEPPAAGLAAAGAALAAIEEAGTAVTQAVAALDDPAASPAASPAATPAATPAAGAAPGSLVETGGMVRLLSGWLPRGATMFDLAAPSSPAGSPAATPAGSPAATPAGSPAATPAGSPAVAGAAAVPADELSDIDLALSLAVTGPSEQWDLTPLRDRLRQAAVRSTSDDERTRAEAIAARLARFEAIQARQRSLVATAPAEAAPLRLGGMWSSLSAVGSRPVRPGVLPGGRPADGRPDWTPPDQMETTGRLATVISRRPDAPRWAIVDGNNDVLAFVTPRPGVSLAPLVGQQVTVRGARGYMPEYRRPYLVAAEALPRLAAGPPPAGGGDTTQ